MTDDKVEAWLKEFKSDFVFIDAGICKLSEAALDELLALVRVYRDAIAELSEQIGQDALQVKFETVWVDHTNVISNLEQSQANMEKWFTITRDAEEKAKEIIDGR